MTDPASILQARTAAAWFDLAAQRTDELLLDHANCEKKGGRQGHPPDGRRSATDCRRVHGGGRILAAITEFKKYLILFPDSGRADYASFRIGMAYYKGEEYRAAVRSFSSMREKYPESAHALPARYQEGFSCWKLKEYEKARITFEALAEETPESGYAPRSLVASSLVALDEDKPDISLAGLKRFPDRYPGHPGAEYVRTALALLERYPDRPRKSPVLAGFLSAVLPGSGYMYAEHYGDGVTAFLINGLFIAGAATGFHQENYAVGTIVAGVGLPFYLGNIYGSANAAKKWNQGVRNEIIEKIHLTLSPLSSNSETKARPPRNHRLPLTPCS